MEKKIKLMCGVGKYADSRTELLTDEELVLEIENKPLNGVKIVYKAQCNDKFIRGTARDYKLVLRNDFLTVGELKLEIVYIKDGITVATFIVEPLILKEIDGKFETIPQIVNLEQKIDFYVKKFEKMQEKCEKMIKLLGATCNVQIDLGGNKND